MFGILSWFLVAIVKYGMAVFPVAYAVSRSRKSQRSKVLEALISSRDALLDKMQRREMQFLVDMQTASAELTDKTNCIAQFAQVTAHLEQVGRDNLRRFEESTAENQSLGLTLQKLETDLFAQGEAAKVAAAATESVREGLNSQLEEGRREMEEEKRKNGRVEAALEELREEKGRMEVELEEMRGEKELAEEIAEEERREAEKAARKRKEAERDLEAVLKGAEERMEEEKAKAAKAEEARDAAVAEMAELRRAFALKEAAFSLKEAAFEAKARHAKLVHQHAVYGTPRPSQPPPPPFSPFVPTHGQWPPPPPPPSSSSAAAPPAAATPPAWNLPTGPRQPPAPPAAAAAAAAPPAWNPPAGPRLPPTGSRLPPTGPRLPPSGPRGMQ